MKRIEQMYAFVVEDEDDDMEGIPALMGASGSLPLVGADMARIESLRPSVEEMAKLLGKPITLLRFEVRTEMEVIEP